VTTTAKLAGSKLAWIDETTADSMFHRLGSHHLAIVELKVDKREEKDAEDEDQVVGLKVTNLTLATNELANHLRDLARAEFLRRKNGNQASLLDDDADSDEIIRRGKAVFRTCQTCLHDRTDETISHWLGDVDSDDAWCTWQADDCEVKAGESYEQHQDNEHPDRGDEQDDEDGGSRNTTEDEGDDDPADNTIDIFRSPATTP
jgi:hypothetical protein